MRTCEKLRQTVEVGEKSSLSIEEVKSDWSWPPLPGVAKEGEPSERTGNVRGDANAGAREIKREKT